MLAFSSSAKTFSPSSAVADGSNEIKIPGHGFVTGDIVSYATDSSITGTEAVKRTSFVGNNTPAKFNPGGQDSDSVPIVDLTQDTIQIVDGHKYVTGQRVRYSRAWGWQSVD